MGEVKCRISGFRKILGSVMRCCREIRPGQSGQQTAGKLHSPICVALCGTVRCLMRKFDKNKELTLILQDQNDTFRTAGCKG